MKCNSALSTAPNTMRRFMRFWSTWMRPGQETADLTLVFASMHHADELGRISSAFMEKRTPPCSWLHRGIDRR